MRKAWNKGLTKNTDERVKKNANSLVGHKHSDETKRKIGLNTGSRRPEVRMKLRQANLGKKLSIETRRKQSEALKGEKSHLWRGGVNSLNRIARNTLEYKLWRESVFKRDNYTCIWCGDNKGGNLEADHIKPFAYYPELRFAIDNGRTLCKNCHKTTDTYGKKQPSIKD